MRCETRMSCWAFVLEKGQKEMGSFLKGKGPFFQGKVPLFSKEKGPFSKRRA